MTSSSILRRLVSTYENNPHVNASGRIVMDDELFEHQKLAIDRFREDDYRGEVHQG